MITTGLLKEVPPFSTSEWVTVGESAFGGVFFGDEQATATITTIKKTKTDFIKFALRKNKLFTVKLRLRSSINQFQALDIIIDGLILFIGYLREFINSRPAISPDFSKQIFHCPKATAKQFSILKNVQLIGQNVYRVSPRYQQSRFSIIPFESARIMFPGPPTNLDFIPT